MGGISSGVGLFSGINSAQLIDQLLSIEARPKALVQARSTGLQQQRAAFLDINTTLSALRSASTKFRTANVFKAARADSSNPDAITASAGNNAAVGSYSIKVQRLVSTQQLLSRGFADSTSAGVGATSFTFETGGGNLATDTKLSELNGGAGIERGAIVVRDASGAQATIDLSTAATVGDVLDTINNATGVRVRAVADGDRLVITDNSGVNGTLTVSNGTGYNTAASLGILGSATGTGASVTGSRVRTISANTALSTLNGGTGVNIRDGSDDLVITPRDGSAAIRIRLGQIETTSGTPPVTTITQTRSVTLGNVIDIINTQGAGKIRAALNSDGTGLVIEDITGSTANNLIVQSLDGRTTAADLGIETSETGVAGNVNGRRLIASLNSTLVSGLRGGQGISETALSITDRNGLATAVTISGAAISGSVSDLLKNVNDQLSAAGNNVRVSLNRAGNGLALSDTLSAGTGDIAASGLAADQLGITTSGATGGSFNGTNVQSKWLGRDTRLASLNGGRGIGTGSIRITDASGAVTTLNIGTSQTTVDDLLRFITNAGNTRVTASINANGDGILLTDTSGGTGSLKVEDVSGTVARSLNLLGSDDNDGGVIAIDGSFEREVTFAATDSLNSIVTKINSAGVGAQATIIRDGTGANPFRLSITSSRSGSVGRVLIDTKNLDLGLTTLVRGDDSLAFFGASDPARAVLLSSNTNTLDSVIQGVTIDLRQATTTAAQITVTKDAAPAEKAFEDFVKAYNDTIDKLNRYDSYNSETQTSGILFGDSTIATIRRSLSSVVQGRPDGVDSTISRLFQIGVTSGSGGKLSFDKNKFRSALEADPAAVEALVAARTPIPRSPTTEIDTGITVNNTSTIETFSRLGIAEKLGEAVDSLTRSTDGTITRRNRTIQNQVESNADRIAQFDIRLESKRLRLERQFADMEKAIASLQGQSSALSSIGVVRR